jgi:hypothetical protein
MEGIIVHIRVIGREANLDLERFSKGVRPVRGKARRSVLL